LPQCLWFSSCTFKCLIWRLCDTPILSILQPQGCEVDVQLAEHRQYLVARCAPAAALLFGPPGGGGAAAAAGMQLQSIPQAAASLAGWSSVGLERLFMDLYQVCF
jgi:hypothetical protein